MRERDKGLNLLSGWAPETFLEPVILVSTVFALKKGTGTRSTAVCFGKALNRHHLLGLIFTSEECYKRAGWELPSKLTSKFIEIKKHKTWDAACKFHLKLITEPEKSYWKLLEKHCPKNLRDTVKFKNQMKKKKAVA